MTTATRTANPLIEIWMNVERVLDAMPEHDRQEHWDMSRWGEKTDCGTVACAAGHCGLDPWFRKRGFKLTFNKQGESKISDVPTFFGFTGANRIFFNSARRSVEEVLSEVREYISELRRIDSLTADLNVPAIGAEWPEQGGHFAGAMMGVDGAPDYLLIVGPEYDGYRTWSDAKAWAAAQVVGEHHDFELPDRREGAALFDRVRSLFQSSWYWLSEQHADYPSYAWGQLFSDGYQDIWYKGDGSRVRAVRRVPIRSLDHSIISGGAS
jgi:hypothetical protein